MGFFEEHMADGSVRRGETFTCSHCNSPEEFKDDRGTKFEAPALCSKCGPKMICKRCARIVDLTGKCVVWEKRMERIEARAKLLKACGIE